MKISRIIVAVICLYLAACDDIGKNSPSQKKYTVGVISGVEFFAPTISGFKDQMATIGYQEGQNITYIVQQARGSTAEMKRIASEYIEQDVDLILTTTNGAAIVAKEASVGTNIPVIFTIVMAPIESGIVDSLSEPQGNISGIRNPLGEFIGKRLDFLKQLVPNTKKVLVLNNPLYPTVPISLKSLRIAAKKLDVQIIDVPVKKPMEVKAYLAQAKETNFDAILIMPDPVVQVQQSLESIFNYAQSNNIPVVANTPKQADDGALFSYLSDSYETGRKAAKLANKLLANRATRNLPIMSSEPKLTLNMKAAKKLGIEVDEALLTLADRVIR